VSLRLARWKQGARHRFAAVRDALVQLELATELNVQTHLGEFVQVRIKPKERKYADTIADVGFGVSQVLPMLVSDAALPPESVLLVNQPEVHLHPSSQALLGEYFSQRIGSRQYVIETHSEYLITRLRILIARKKLRPEDVNLYFVMPTPSEDGTLIRHIRLDEAGGFIDPPKEFFRTYITDSYELALSSFPES
jgi:predicted ATPase